MEAVVTYLTNTPTPQLPAIQVSTYIAWPSRLLAVEMAPVAGSPLDLGMLSFIHGD